MTKLGCSGCGRSVEVDSVKGDEVCKECNKPMNKVTGENAQEIVDDKKGVVEEKKDSKIVLPAADNLCGELPNFADKQII